jgi:hypothetical protein
MAGLRDLQKKLRTITGRKIENDLLLIVKSLESDLIDLNLSQLQKGETRKGKQLPFYAGTKEPWKLFDTGKFYGGWFVKPTKDLILFGSSDSKTTEILDKLEQRGIKNPQDIFGLSEKNFIQFQRLLVPRVKQYFRELLSV